MRLSELAADIGMTPTDLLVRLVDHPRWKEIGNPEHFMGPLQALKIPTHLVEVFREFALETAAEEVIDHVKEKNGHIQTEDGDYPDPSDPGPWEDEDDDS
jgi:hypothetical protein